MRQWTVMVVAVLAFVALLAALKETTPGYAMLTGPIRTYGHQDAVVSGTKFSARTGAVVMAKSIVFDRFGKTVDLQSSGIWVVASIEAQAFAETMPLRAATLVGASGRKYRQSQRAGDVPNVLSMKTVQPGLPTKGIVVFEIPADERQGMRLLLSEQYDPQLADEIEISLDQGSDAIRDRLEIGKNGL